MSEQHNLQISNDYYSLEQDTTLIEPVPVFSATPKLSPNLFAQFKSNFFNEMLAIQQLNGEMVQKIAQWLSARSLAELQQLQDQAKQHLLYQGTSFNVYAEQAGIERSIPFDLIPRVIEMKQWQHISSGCVQRVKALNLFLDDIYHDQNILNDGLIPAQQVMTHSAFQPHMLKHHLQGKIYAHISGIDVVRDETGEFFALEDNLRMPSGVSYMVECRKISQKLMPNLCNSKNLQGIEHYPDLLKTVLMENADVDKPLYSGADTRSV